MTTIEIPDGATATVTIHAKTWEEFEEGVAYLKTRPEPGDIRTVAHGVTVWAVRREGAVDYIVFAPKIDGAESPGLTRARAVVDR